MTTGWYVVFGSKRPSLVHVTVEATCLLLTQQSGDSKRVPLNAKFTGRWVSVTDPREAEEDQLIDNRYAEWCAT